MRLRFSCVAFVPPDAQLGVSGSPSFLGRWDPYRCIPLLPYSAPAEGGVEPSLWFADVEVDEECLDGAESPGGAQDGCSNHRCPAAADAHESFCDRLLAAVARANGTKRGIPPPRNRGDGRSTVGEEALSLAAAATCRIDHRAPEVVAVLELHPLRRVHFEYKFILWAPKKPVTPYVPDMPGEAFACSAYGSPSCTWRTWLFPPPPAQRAEPPAEGLHVVWEGIGPSNNRKFSFDPLDVVVDECENGKLEVLYLCKIARFEDPRGGPHLSTSMSLLHKVNGSCSAVTVPTVSARLCVLLRGND